ncbi:hypothetical protein KI387_011641 [Taxus chinensis]|uniref:Uncharacterized protein n=1 Tax=Taxus chinensis TaxID=29808 RepID=A0AA38CJX0_TAXCH|nr:hypothetical protein KI387_011641 [Taxus chinensis]
MTTHEVVIEGLAGISRQTQLISYDHVGQYLQRRNTSSGGSSSNSDAHNEVYTRAYLISLDEFEAFTTPAQTHRLGRIMAANLLRAYEASAPVCGASQPAPFTHMTYIQLLTENIMDLDVLGLSQLGSLGNIFASVEVEGGNSIDLETRSAKGATEPSEGSGTRLIARRRLQ